MGLTTGGERRKGRLMMELRVKAWKGGATAGVKTLEVGSIFFKN